MKLKTLKELKRKPNNAMYNIGFLDCMIASKQEAIKWIKFLRTKPKAITYNGKKIKHDFKESIAWISEFFNITEEDIK